MSLKYTTVYNKHTDIEAIKLLEYPYEGIIYSYGKVSFEEDEVNDHVTIKFEYDILDNANKSFDIKLFEQYIGDLLQELIHQGIAQNNITYTGGTDNENRTGDIIEPDKQ
jgi:hypothetical protein